VDNDKVPVLQEVKTGQCPKCLDITGHSPVNKNSWAQWSSPSNERECAGVPLAFT
jgi:hypothetical protein